MDNAINQLVRKIVALSQSDEELRALIANCMPTITACAAPASDAYMYRYMLDVAKENGFDSLTDAINTASMGRLVPALRAAGYVRRDALDKLNKGASVSIMPVRSEGFDSRIPVYTYPPVRYQRRAFIGPLRDLMNWAKSMHGLIPDAEWRAQRDEHIHDALRKMQFTDYVQEGQDG